MAETADFVEAGSVELQGKTQPVWRLSRRMNVFEQATIWWVIAFAVGIPLSMVVLTEVIGFLQQRSHPAVGPLRLLRNWVIPVAGLLVLLAFAIQSPADQVWVRVVATVFGLLLILLVLSALQRRPVRQRPQRVLARAHPEDLHRDRPARS